jgi:hypothetical protein
MMVVVSMRVGRSTVVVYVVMYVVMPVVLVVRGGGVVHVRPAVQERGAGTPARLQRRDADGHGEQERQVDGPDDHGLTVPESTARS